MANFKATTSSLYLLLSLFLITAVATDAAAKERAWYKYENDYFEAFSDASEKSVRRLLEELENFRAAVIQMNGNRVPDGAVKTQVVIFDSKKQFGETISIDSVDAYATGIRGVPHIVMSAGRISKWSRTTIRHEFVHVLQGYSSSRLPPWYVEGFAEFLSGMTFRDENTRFTIGDYPGRAKARSSLVDWEELISDDFDFHQISSAEKASNAYLQSWMLVHYLTLGDEQAHNRGLLEYLTLYNRGAASVSTFAEVFGESADEMGPRISKQYGRRFYPLVVNFLPGYQDHDFERMLVDPSIAAEIIDDLKAADRERSN
jgi:hypothetical protein